MAGRDFAVANEEVLTKAASNAAMLVQAAQRAGEGMRMRGMQALQNRQMRQREKIADEVRASQEQYQLMWHVPVGQLFDLWE